MSEQPSQEPTMEEILASIRRIISEDESTPEAVEDAPPEVAAATVPEPQPEPAPLPMAAPPAPEPEPSPQPVAKVEPLPPAVLVEEEDDDLELTQKVETHGDLDVFDAEPEIAPPPPAAAASLVSAQVAAVTAASFDKLSATIAMPAAGRTLEDVVREMLRPMLQQWLDENLPGIVQEAVQAEVDRISRSRVR